MGDISLKRKSLFLWGGGGGGRGHESLVWENILLTCFLFSYNLFLTIYVLVLNYRCSMQTKLHFLLQVHLV